MSSTSVSSAGSSSLYTIDKLSSSNFTSWKFRMQMILIDRGLWEYVDGNPVAPVLDGTDAARLRLAEWKKKDNCALAQIALTVGNSELVHVKGAKSAAEAWKKICGVYEAKGLAAKIFLRRRFFNIKLREGESMQTHINAVRELADQLEAIGAPVTDGDIAMTLLCSLPQQYDSLIVALEARPANELTGEFVASRLLAEEKRRQESFDVKVKSTTEAAFVGNLSDQSGKKNGRTCWNCNKPGHFAHQCYRKKRDPGNKSHVAAVSQSTGDDSSNKPVGDEDLYGFVTSMEKTEVVKVEWIIDSAASDHYCNSRELFANFQSIPARNIKLGKSCGSC